MTKPVTEHEIERYWFYLSLKLLFGFTWDFKFEYVRHRPIHIQDVASGGQEGENEEEIMESENSESLEGDDCEVVVEDTLGCK